MNAIQKLREWNRKPKSISTQIFEVVFIIIPIAFLIRTFFYGLYQVPTGSMETTMLVGEGFFANKFSILFSDPQRGQIITFNDPNFEYSSNRWMNLFQRYVWGPSNWTKRVIGIPGDHVKGVMEEGKPVVYLNGVKLDEPYLNKYPIVGVYKAGCMPPWVYKSYDPDYAFDKQPFYIMTEDDVLQAKRYMPRYGEPWERAPQTPYFNPYGRNVDIYDVHLGPNEYWVMGDNRLGSYDCRSWGMVGKPLDGSLIHGTIVFRLWSVDIQGTSLLFDLIKHPIDFWTRVRWSRFFQVVR